MSAPTPEEQVEEFAASIGAEAPYRDLSAYQPIELFHTPESLEALQKQADTYSGSERMIANLFIALTWNCICKQLNG